MGGWEVASRNASASFAWDRITASTVSRFDNVIERFDQSLDQHFDEQLEQNGGKHR
ncbi:hypothetical protein [Brevundimonas diminuta]|uniref:hypothetical protein n=1 Tax=Brevundimonas diminuta TaxID=293 RepID=UPI001377413F|nr:hypothetical protein [Brevundimonas diminuta]